MAKLMIHVGVSMDRSLTTAYQPVIDAANKAAAATTAAGKRSGAAIASETKKGTSAADKEYAKLAKAAEGWQRAAVKSAEKAGRDEVKSAERSAREQIRAAQSVTKAKKSEGEKQVRDAAAAAERGASARARAHDRDAKLAQRHAGAALRSGGNVAREVFGMGRSAVGSGFGVAMSGLGGMGVQVDAGHMVKQNSDLETLATSVSNSGYMAGDRRNGQRVDKNRLMEQAFSVGNSTGTDANVALEGLAKFTAKTGDLQTGRDILQQMAVLSKATGTNLGDMLDASGDVANQLGDVEGKGELIRSVMTSIAAQGKLGAVEIRDLAKQMAKVAASATMYTGNRVEVMKDMGALVQGARGTGGAVSASQAATSLGSFTNVFGKGARRKAFDEAGVKVEAADKQLRRPIEIIKDALRATGGDTVEMHKMFADVASQKITRPYETAFKDAGGGEAGIVAVQKKFDDLRSATIAEEEVARSFANAMKNSQSQTEIFNNQMRQSALRMQQDLTPAMQQLAPAVVNATKSLANAVTWLTGDKQLQNSLTNAKEGVPDAIKATEKQIAGGVIAEPTRADNKQQEAEARDAFSRASIAYEQAKEEADAKKNGPKSINQKVFERFDAVMAATGRSTDTSGNKAAGEKVADAKATMEESRKLFQDMLTENAKVSTLLASGTIRVIIANPTPTKDVPLSTPGAGVESKPWSQ